MLVPLTADMALLALIAAVFVTVLFNILFNIALDRERVYLSSLSAE